MIPRVKPTDPIFGNSLRIRVTACRRRLRDHRSVQRAQARELATDSDNQNMAQFPAGSAAVRQLASLDLSPALGDSQAEYVVEQEVGIT